jgi:hypothetical protein
MKISVWCAALLASALLGVAAEAAFVPGSYFVNPSLPGATQFDGWTNSGLLFSANPGFPGFPGTGAWPSSIGSNAAGSGDATLLKTANGTGGGPYPAGGSLYYGGFSGDINNNGGQLTVTDNSPVADLANVVFQVDIGEAWTYDFWNDALPVLNCNGGGQNLVPSNAVLLNKYDNGTVTMPTGEETVYINTHLLQWDLSSVGPVTNFSVSFNGVQHGQVYALQLNQGSVYAQVPEPATFGLVGLCVAGLIGVRRRER